MNLLTEVETKTASSQSLFGSHIFQQRVNDSFLTNSLADLALNYKRNLGALTPENHCIWDWPYPQMSVLKSLMLRGFEQWAGLYGHQLQLDSDPLASDYIRHAWAQVYEEGSYGKLHSHQFADATAVFYVTKDSGCSRNYLEIFDPRWVNDAMLYVRDEKSSIEVRSEEGLLVVFPGNLWHSIPEQKTLRSCFVSTFEYSSVRRVLERN